MTDDQTDPTTEELAARMRQGDESALAEAFERARGALERMVEYRIDVRLRNRLSADDVIQDAYLAAQQRLSHYDETLEVPPAVWLRWIVGQRLVELHRRHLAKRRDAGRELSMDQGVWQMSSSAALVDRLAAPGAGPSTVARGGEQRSQLAEALESLSPMDREVLVLRHFEELSNDDVAALLGLEKSAASKRYVRALARLREAMGEGGQSASGA